MADASQTRRLSIPRLALLLLIIGVVATSVTLRQLRQSEQAQIDPVKLAWFASYVDVTATPTFSFQNMGEADKSANAVLSFIVALKSEPCTPSWGSVYTLDKANSSLSLDTRIGRLKQRGGSVAISFGGQLNNELAVGCTDPVALSNAYKAVIERYGIDTVDFDIEEGALKDATSIARRAEVVGRLQKQRRDDNKNLAVWLTLPVSPSGLTEAGTDVIAAFLRQKVDISGVNVMTMNYGDSLPEGQTMFEGTRSALLQTKRQLGILYEQAGIYLDDANLWSKIGVTPMIGQNEFADEIFSLEDAHDLNTLAQDYHLGRVSIWSANRDVACGSNYVNIKIVSDSCSGITQEALAFTTSLSNGFNGDITSSSGQVTVSGQAINREEIVDDPDKSPYQIWQKNGTYLQGTKVVWRKNVYQAKWWTQGDMPDNPVLQTWQTPWELIGPVLPGDKPIPQPKLPKGTYPDWQGTSTYNAGQRVLFEGVPYQAKWWTQGDSPAKTSADPNGSPWLPLTQEQIETILDRLNSSNN